MTRDIRKVILSLSVVEGHPLFELSWRTELHLLDHESFQLDTGPRHAHVYPKHFLFSLKRPVRSSSGFTALWLRGEKFQHPMC
jgi:hypothetical protein